MYILDIFFFKTKLCYTKAYDEICFINLDYSWCNIGSKTLLAKQGELPLKLTCPINTSTCPATLLNKGESHCDDLKQFTCQAGQVRVLFSLPDYHFLSNSLAICNGASGYVARCYFHSLKAKCVQILSLKIFLIQFL